MDVCCEDELSKSILRDRFARAGLSQKDSNYKFLNELRDTLGQYIKMSNIVLINYIVEGIAGKQALAKSVELNRDALVGADDMLLKAMFGKMIKKAGRFLRKWLSKPPKPLGKIRTIYDPAKEDLTDQEWNNIDDIIFSYIRDEQVPAATEMLTEAYRSGMQTGQITAGGRSEGSVSKKTFDQMKHWQAEHADAKTLKQQGLSDDWAYAAVWARDNAAKQLAVYNDDGERDGHAYNAITRMFREQIRTALENQEDASQLRSRLIFPETWTDIDGYTKHLSEILTNDEMKEYTVAHLNRDWDRFAFNEVQSAFDQGKLVRWSKFDVAYTEMARIRNRGKSCPFCEANRGTICRLFPSEQEFIKSDYYGGSDKVVGDKRASVAVWPGKNNVGRSFASWWVCAPAHPYCFSNDTEVLTNEGWKLFQDVQYGDLIFSLNHQTEALEFVAFNKKIEYNYSGRMIHLKARGYDSLVTTNHRIPVTIRRGRFRIKTKEIQEADYLLDASKFTIPRTGLWPSSSDYGEDLENSKRLAKLYAWYLSEGTRAGGSGFYISQENQENIRIIQDLLDEMNLDNKLHKSPGVYVNTCALTRRILRDCPGKSHEKMVPQFIKDGSREVIEAFLYTYCLGDGTRRIRNCFGYVSREVVYYTSSKRMMADLCELILKAGRAVHTSITNPKGKIIKHHNGEFAINHDVYCITESRSKNVLFCPENASSISIETYNGTVHCLSLEKNHILLTRRNGVVCWSGNCNDSMILVG